MTTLNKIEKIKKYLKNLDCVEYDSLIGKNIDKDENIYLNMIMQNKKNLMSKYLYTKKEAEQLHNIIVNDRIDRMKDVKKFVFGSSEKLKNNTKKNINEVFKMNVVNSNYLEFLGFFEVLEINEAIDTLNNIKEKNSNNLNYCCLSALFFSLSSSISLIIKKGTKIQLDNFLKIANYYIGKIKNTHKNFYSELNAYYEYLKKNNYKNNLIKVLTF